MSTPVIVLVGPPTAGKSTAVRALRRAVPDLAHFAVRVYFQEQAALGTPVGRQAYVLARRQRFLPDEFVGAEVDRWLGDRLAGGATGVLLEGFPRNTAQAGVLAALLSRRDLRVDAFLHLDIPDEVAFARSRRLVCMRCETFVEDGIPVPDAACPTCAGPVVLRPDDVPEVFAERLAAHRASVAELLGHYEPRGVVRRIDGTADRDKVEAQVIEVITDLVAGA